MTTSHLQAEEHSGIRHPRAPSHGEIARLAYHYYEARGHRAGHDVDDWLTAERQLMHDLALAERWPGASLLHSRLVHNL